MSGPDGLNYYWHDLRRARDEVEWGPNKRDSIMLWRVICYKGAIGLKEAVGFMGA